MNIVSDEKCSMCKKENETLLHLFWECEEVKVFIANITEYIKRFHGDFQIDCKTFLLGNPKKNLESYNILCLEIKRYMYLCKRKNIVPNLIGLKGSLKLALSIVKNTNILDSKLSYWSMVKLLCEM